jgi:hypothetical protein
MSGAGAISSKHSIINPLLIILYLYQYGFLIPLLIRFDSQLPIAVFTALLVVVYFIANQFTANPKSYILIGIPLLLILFKTAFTPNLIGEDNTNEILLNFLTIGISGILIGSVTCDHEKLLHYGTIIGWINFLILFSIPLQKIDAVNYMRFGYAMLPTFCFTVYSFLKKENMIINGIIALVSGIEIIIFGARGSFLVICIFALIIFFVFSNNRKKLLSWFLLLSVVALLYLFYDSIILGIDRLLGSFGYSSYSITKLMRLVEGVGDLESTSSGRFDLYRVGLENVSENPLFGAPLNSALVDSGAPYYHNLLLDILVSFGFIAFICFVIFVANSFSKMERSDNMPLKWIYCILFVLSFGRLMVSSVFWQRPEFWLFISFYITNSNYFKKTDSQSDNVYV